MHDRRKGISPVAARVSTLVAARRRRQPGGAHRRVPHRLVSTARRVGPRLRGREGRLGRPGLPSRLSRFRAGKPWATLRRRLRRSRRAAASWWTSHTLDAMLGAAALAVAVAIGVLVA